LAAEVAASPSSGGRHRSSQFACSGLTIGLMVRRGGLHEHVSKRWAWWHIRAGLDGVRLHDLRHFMAATMLTAGVPVSVVAGRLGLARPTTAPNVDSHFVDSGGQHYWPESRRSILTILLNLSAGPPTDGVSWLPLYVAPPLACAWCAVSSFEQRPTTVGMGIG